MCFQNFLRTQVKELEPSCIIAGGNVKWYSDQFLKKLNTKLSRDTVITLFRYLPET